LQVAVSQENQELQQKSDPLKNYEIVERRRWEHSAHPYLFFNDDESSITFVGFRVSKAGDLLHPGTGAILRKAVVSQGLMEDLKRYGVDLNEDWMSWTKDTMIQKLATVMGLRYEHGNIQDLDPDKSYVLTVDNLIKILAIQMRFK